LPGEPFAKPGNAPFAKAWKRTYFHFPLPEARNIFRQSIIPNAAVVLQQHRPAHKMALWESAVLCAPIPRSMKKVCLANWLDVVLQQHRPAHKMAVWESAVLNVIQYQDPWERFV
jgi:hypothetical protein